MNELEDDNYELEDDLPSMIALSSEDNKIRITGIYGDIDEERARDTLISLLSLYHTNKESEENEEEPISRPIEFLISTGGGSISDMFAIYDTIRYVREEVEIHTRGIGRVMSAGILLLASGTKGHRKIGKYCRLMFHNVIGGQHGPLHEIKNSYDEAVYQQDLLLKALSEETNMSVEHLDKLVSKNIDVYFSAEEAVELGIADIIV